MVQDTKTAQIAKDAMKSYETVSDRFGGAPQGVVWTVGGYAWWLFPQSLIRYDADTVKLTEYIWMVPQWPN